MLRRAVLILFVMTAVALSGRSAEVENLLPPETELVVQVNLSQFLEAGLVKKFALGQVRQMLEGNEAQKMIKKIGLDPMKDVTRITFGSWGHATDKDEPKLAFAIRGTFNAEKLIAAAKDEAKNKSDATRVSVLTEDDRTILKFTLEKRLQPFYLQIIDSKTIVGSTERSWLADAEKASKGNDKPKFKKELLTLLESQDEKAAIFAAGVASGDEKIEVPNGFPGIEGEKITKQLQNLRTFSLALKITDDLELSMTAGIKDKDSATEFGKTVAELLDMGKSLLPLVTIRQPRAKPLVDEINKSLISQVKEKDVVVGLKISSENIGKFFGDESEKEEKRDEKKEEKKEGQEKK